MASTSSTASQSWKYEVFLSFRGRDTRDGFGSHLFDALCRKQIITFKDENLDRGEDISSALLQTIEESHVSIVIFSENYAYSPWCLDELQKIVYCKKELGQIVLPVFYKLDPTDVQELTGSFGDAILKHQEQFRDCSAKVENWSSALKEIAGMAGFVYEDIRPESRLIEVIVNHVLEKLDHACSSKQYNDGLVGIDSRIKDVESLLHMQATDVRFLGIWGMGGIGKTTIAAKVFDRISSLFEGRCFVANVREKLEDRKLDGLLHEILSEVLGEDNLNLGMPIMLTSFIRKQIMRKKILLVLDDVSDSEQLDLFIGKHDIYGPGSRIILTSRDKQIFRNGNAEIYEVKELDNREALQLLNMHAFKQNPQTEAHMKLAKDLVKYAQGIPLALKVLGSILYNKSIEEWEDELEKLKHIPNKKIHQILRISYDELEENEKEIFLDIACFFKSEDKNHVESILQSCGFFARIGISRLLDKSLITMSENNKLCMHDLLQQMGKDIVREECIKNPEKRSRLWIPRDIFHVLTKDLDTSSVESISLDMSKIRDVELSSMAFVRMKKLRLLKFYNPYYQKGNFFNPCFGKIKVHLPKGLRFLADELRFLYWYQYPLKSLPLNFFPNNLVQLHLINSHVEQLCNRDQCLDNLKFMDLSYSKKLISIPNLSGLPKLEILYLRGCTSLVKIGSYTQHDTKLTHIDLQNCKNLCSFFGLHHLKNLVFLSLEGCPKIREFPRIPQNIGHLILNGTAIDQVPSSIVYHSRLLTLELGSCIRLKSFPSSIGELKCLNNLNLNGCSELASLPSSIDELKYLKRLNLNGCSKLMTLPDGICSLNSLECLEISNCVNLNGLPENLGNLESLELLVAAKSGIKKLPSSINRLSKLEDLDCCGCKGLILPPFTGLSCLKYFSVEDCDILEISSSLGSLESLSRLYLGGNNLEGLPVTIKQLSRLQVLSLSDNRRLKYLPELPFSLEYLSVRNCTSLESISISLTKAIKDFLLWLDAGDYINLDQNALWWVDAGNCINLDQNACRKWLDDMLMTIERKSAQIKYQLMFAIEEQISNEYEGVLTYIIWYYIAGGDVPQRMSYQNNSGSSLSISLSPDPHDFMVIAFCAVVEFNNYHSRDFQYLKCKCSFAAKSGHTFDFKTGHQHEDFSLGGTKISLPMGKPDMVLQSEHVFLWLSTIFLNSKYSFNEASFDFYFKNEDARYYSDNSRKSCSAKVVKCGVHLLFDDNDIDLSFSKDRERPRYMGCGWNFRPFQSTRKKKRKSEDNCWKRKGRKSQWQRERERKFQNTTVRSPSYDTRRPGK